MKKRIKSAIFFCLYYSGVEWLLARIWPARAAVILMYHGVCDRSVLPAHIDFHLSKEQFEHQMRALKGRYPVRPLGEVVDSIRRGETPQKCVVLTFDDGYRNNLTQAAPVLAQLALPYTVFLATGFVGSDRWLPLNEIYWRWWSKQISFEQMTELRSRLRTSPARGRAEILGEFPKPAVDRDPASLESFDMLSWDEVRSMIATGAEFGSHTRSHCNMAVESNDDQRAELRSSRETLEQELRTRTRFFAYPYGRNAQMSALSRTNVIAAGYECALSAEFGLATAQSDLFCLPRLGYDKRPWMFTGELLYQLVRQTFRAMMAPPLAPAQVSGGGERHG